MLKGAASQLQFSCVAACARVGGGEETAGTTEAGQRSGSEAEAKAEDKDLFTQLDDWWYDFWMGEYWNQPIAVAITPVTVFSMAAFLTSLSYFTVQVMTYLKTAPDANISLL